jgi:hypothetical protein
VRPRDGADAERPLAVAPRRDRPARLTLEELELTELFGKGGGGPRCLVNELRGLVLTANAPDYGSRREELLELVDRYPEEPRPTGAPLPPTP